MRRIPTKIITIAFARHPPIDATGAVGFEPPSDPFEAGRPISFTRTTLASPGSSRSLLAGSWRRLVAPAISPQATLLPVNTSAGPLQQRAGQSTHQSGGDRMPRP